MKDLTISFSGSTAGAARGETNFGLAFNLYWPANQILLASPCCNAVLFLAENMKSAHRCSSCKEPLSAELADFRFYASAVTQDPWVPWVSQLLDPLTSVLVAGAIAERVAAIFACTEADAWLAELAAQSGPLLAVLVT